MEDRIHRARPVPQFLSPDSWRPKLDILLDKVAAAGVAIDAGGAKRLEAYCRAVGEWSERVGLVSPRDLREFVEKHIGPSLGPLLVAPVQPGERWVDVGSGAGLPGLVIKLSRPELNMTLIDSSRKKTIFLEAFCRRIQLQDLQILEARAELLSHHGASPAAGGHSAGSRHEPAAQDIRPFDVILMRAVAPLKKSLSLVDPIAADRARLVTYKGPDWQSEVEVARDKMESLGWTLLETCQIPWAKSRLVILQRRVEYGAGIAGS